MSREIPLDKSDKRWLKDGTSYQVITNSAVLVFDTLDEAMEARRKYHVAEIHSLTRKRIG